MSIVTYFPKGELEFVLTISTEEASPNHSLLPTILNQGSKQILYPSDSQEEGTFAAASADGTVVCVFKSTNSSFDPKTSYKQSIRRTPLDYFKYGNIFSFYLNYDFQKVEPFIMVIFQDKKLYEIKWDGETHVVKNLLQKQKYFWSSIRSSQDNEMITKEIDQFESWSATTPDFGVLDIKRFHQALIIKRETNSSVSDKEEKRGITITTIVFSSNEITVECENILANYKTENSLPLLLKQELKY